MFYRCSYILLHIITVAKGKFLINTRTTVKGVVFQKTMAPVQYKYMSATRVQTSLTAVSTVRMGRKPLVGTLQNIGQFRKMKERLQAAPKLETGLAIEVHPPALKSNSCP